MSREEQRLKFEKDYLDTLDGVSAYFVKPDNTGLKYPAAIYDRTDKPQHANNSVYLYRPIWTITYITRKFLDSNVDTLMAMPKVTKDREFQKDGLYHHIFTIIL